MSAYIVDPRTIDYLVAWAVQLEADSPLDPDSLGALLMRENVRAVRYRYPDESADTLPGPVDQSRIWSYRFEPIPCELKPAWVVKAARCLRYQSCEHPDYDGSPASTALEIIERSAMLRNPTPAEIEAAPWGISDEDLARREPVKRRTPTAEARYLTCAETAKLLRAALKAEFPGVRFGVRSHTYAGGASINVEWLDGPTEAEVRAISDRYAGADFDGMIDMQTYRRHWLTPQGEVFVAQVAGTEGQRGTIPSAEYIRPHDEAELVRLGAHYVHTTRHYSRRMLERAADWAATTWGERPEVREYEHSGGCYLHAERPADPYRYGGGVNATVAEVAYREIRNQPGPRHKDRTK